MTIPVQPLSPDLSVAPQLGPEAMQALADAGYKSVINNRPDFEGGPNQPTNASIEAAAKAAGLAYAFLPVASGHQTPDEIARFAELLAALPRPIVAFCRSGTRSGKLFRAATGG
jgi:uncharacterized protein (TIGR01244 family)